MNHLRVHSLVLCSLWLYTPVARAENDPVEQEAAEQISAYSDNWSRLNNTKKLRALSLASRHLERSKPSRNLIVRGAKDTDSYVRDKSLRILARAGSVVAEELALLAIERNAVGDRAALLLARNAPDLALAPLLELFAKNDLKQQTLRSALHSCLRRSKVEQSKKLSNWESLQAPPENSAVLAGILSTHGEYKNFALELWKDIPKEQPSFELKWYLLRSTPKLPHDEQVDQWLKRTALNSKEWMLRSEALGTLMVRNATTGKQSAQKLVRDPYPRVRLAALRVLEKHTQTEAMIQRLVHNDPWPMVRSQALLALAKSNSSTKLLRASLDDHAFSVRAAAIAGLRVRGDKKAWPLVSQRLQDDDEWPQVLSEAIKYSGALCIKSSKDALLNLLKRGLKPNAWAPDSDIAMQAYDSLLRLGGQARSDAIRVVESRGLSSYVQLAKLRKKVCD